MNQHLYITPLGLIFIIHVNSHFVKNFREGPPLITFFYKKVDKPQYYGYTIEYNYIL